MATGVSPNVVLNWDPGDGALSHDVFFGTDYDAVAQTGSIAGIYELAMLADQWLGYPRLPAAHWQLDEDSGPIAYDGSGYVNNGTLIGGPSGSQQTDKSKERLSLMVMVIM